MPQKRLSTLLAGVELRDRRGSDDPIIHGICHDSRTVTNGSLFVATRGFHTDGHAFLEDALARGAVALVVERLDAVPNVPARLPVSLVPDARQALSRAAAAFYDHPSHDLFVIGVTGTDGKSSTASFIEQILSSAGYPTGLISTVTVKTGDTSRKNPNRQSTPEAVSLHGYLADMRDAGKQFAVVEATSHGLSLRTARLADVRFEAAVFTNLSHEHLEFHGTLEQYRSDKANLFRALDHAGAKAFGVVNANDEHASYMESTTNKPIFRYAVEPYTDKNGPLHLFARDLSPQLDGTSFTLLDEQGTGRPARVPMPGTFQVENALAALLAASQATGLSALELSRALEHLEAVDGRLVPVGKNLPFAVVVDYAHTPNSYEKLFPIIRTSTPGRIIAVFGSAGERDVEKRPLQGAVAARHVDLIVLCDEDPREEDGERIISEIARGISEAAPQKREGVDYLIIPDRTQAIREAVDRARPGDTVVLLGKGHESNMIYPDGPRPWNEAEVARTVLIEAGYNVAGSEPSIEEATT